MSSDFLSSPGATSGSMPMPETPISQRFRSRGFLPEADPLTAFSPNSEFTSLDEIGRDLPSLLHDPNFRQYARTLNIPL